MIRVTTPEGVVRLDFSNIAPNPDIPDSHFRLDTPKGLKPLELKKGESLIGE